ncbi:MAG: amidohydrolase family protein, partial [Chloroflexi bacterium]|nr:amidohydrolase family protein [Chloroflexota bacterium]
MTKQAGIQGPEWRIGTAEALAMYTTGSAWSSMEERVKGTLAPGKFADLVVLDQDPLTVEPEALKDVGVAATIVNGKVVYERDNGLNADAPGTTRAAALEGSGCEHDD